METGILALEGYFSFSPKPLEQNLAQLCHT